MDLVKVTLATSVLALLMLVSVPAVFGCECSYKDMKASVSEAFEKATTVITVTVVSVSEPEYLLDHQSIKMRVEKVYKGKVKAGEVLSFWQGMKADCLWGFTTENIGKSYLFYLGKPTKALPYRTNEEIEKSDAEAKFYVSTCSTSAAIEKAGGDIIFLDNLKKPD